MSKKNNNHRKEKKDEPDCDNGPFGAPVEEDGNNNEQNNGDAGPKEDPAFEVSIDWKLDAERRAWLAALREDIATPEASGSDITGVA